MCAHKGDRSAKRSASLEHVFSSPGRLRILRALAKAGELNIMELIRRTGLNYATVDGHLKALQRLGMVREKRLGRVRMCAFNEENPRAKALKEFLNLWNQV